MSGYDRSLYQTYLSQVPMFSSCTNEQLDRIAELGTAITVTDGHPIVREGETGDDFFGELALFDPAPRNATITAASQVSLVSLHRDHFKGALDAAPGLRDALLHGMAHRLHELDSHA